jgi:uncharacterized protein YlxW (UPF0749 family)
LRYNSDLTKGENMAKKKEETLTDIIDRIEEDLITLRDKVEEMENQEEEFDEDEDEDEDEE